MLRSVKDDLDLNVRIHCECGVVYVRQTGRSIETRCKNTGDTSVSINRTSLRWWSTTQDIVSTSATPSFWTERRAICTVFWKRPLASDWTTKTSTGMVASCWAVLGILWYTWYEIRQPASRSKLLTPANNSHWLAHQHERATRAGLYLARTDFPDTTSVPWRRGQRWSSKRWFFVA
jgi:hypothetical protein